MICDPSDAFASGAASDSDGAGEAGSGEKLDARWYCVRSKPKSEHLAAAHLRRMAVTEELDIPVFCPRIRYQKATRRGKVWFVEALFPGYLFACFDLATQMRAVQAQPAVSGILHFGDYFPEISALQVKELQGEFDEQEVREVSTSVEEGDEVEIVDGALKGLTVVVSRLMPGTERVRILMEWMGEDREAEVSLDAIARKGNVRSGPMS